MKKVIGIDLGTTNSVVAVMEGGEPCVIKNSEGSRSTPSVVAYTKKGDKLVGQVAKRQAVLNAENTFYSVKRFIGCKSSEVSNDLKQVSYDLDETSFIKIKCPALDKSFAPEEISAQVIRKLTDDAIKFIGESVDQAVITVPAYFNDAQRQATKDAGQIAGLEVLRIINEPTAASLSYGLDKKNNETILVFDLGGGTFDVSILEVGDGVFEVLSTSGDTKLGGDDFDEIIVRWLINEFIAEKDIDLSNNKQALQRLMEASESAKIELSTASKADINLPFISLSNDGPQHLQRTLTKSKFEELSAHLIERCEVPVKNALRDAKLDNNDIDEVVFVGGSTRIPAVKELVNNILQKTPNEDVNPDEVVAVGAAIQAGVLSGEIKDLLLLDVTPLSLGVETFGGVTTTIIPRNTTVPIQKSELFSTAQDNQTSVEIKVLQGERALSTDNKNLGTFILNDINLAPRGIPQIEVSFDINSNGILSVSATDKNTGKEQAITITGAANLSQDEISQMVEDAEKNASQDKEQRDQIELKNSAESVVYKSEEFLKQATNLSTDITTTIETTTKELKSAIANNDFSTMETLSPKLLNLIYANGKDGSQPQENNMQDDGVVDVN